MQLDYQDFLRQHELTEWDKDHPALMDFKQRRISDITAFRSWVQDIRKSMPGIRQSAIVANGALSLLNLTIYLLQKQLNAQAETFEQEGGFTEHLYAVRQKKRKGDQ